MTTTAPFQTTDTIASIVERHPDASRLFEQAGLDYCCGGKLPLAEACRRKGIDPQEILAALDFAAEPPPATDPAALTLTQLADHIVATHHAYLRSELPRLAFMTEKVARVHGGEDGRLVLVHKVFSGLSSEMFSHMQKEEEILFPVIRQMEAGTGGSFHCGSVAGPITQMEHEHSQAGNALAQLNALTDGYQPPTWACNTYRAMLDGLATLERDLHQHVHKENNILFPRALALEK
jgi:regulator of cell morphogenesis and NO signaling